MEVGLGHSYFWSGKGVLFAAVDGRVQSSYKNSGAIALTSRVGFVSDASRFGKMGVWLGYRDFLESYEQDDWVIKFEHRIGKGRGWDFRISYEYDVAVQYSVAVSRYW